MSSIHVSSLCASLGAASHISGPPSGRPRRIQYQHRPPSTRTPGCPITNEAIAPLLATPRSGVAITCRLAIVQRRHVPPAAVSTRGTWHVARAAGLWRILGGWLPAPGTIPPRPSRYRPVLLPPPPPAGPGQDKAGLSAAEFYWHSPQIAGLVWSRERQRQLQRSGMESGVPRVLPWGVRGAAGEGTGCGHVAIQRSECGIAVQGGSVVWRVHTTPHRFGD